MLFPTFKMDSLLFLLVRQLGCGGCIPRFLLCESLACLITASRRKGTCQCYRRCPTTSFLILIFPVSPNPVFLQDDSLMTSTTWMSRPPNPTMHLSYGPSRWIYLHLSWGNLNGEGNDFQLEGTMPCGPLCTSFVSSPSHSLDSLIV